MMGSTLSFKKAFLSLSKFDRALTLFWLAGPFIMLIERTPADVWLSIISITFLSRSIWCKEFYWLKEPISQSFIILALVFFVSAALSPMPLTSMAETLAWCRFPLFAAAILFWLGNSHVILKAYIYALLAATFLMGCILGAELFFEGHKHGRLEWPYGDRVPGNYLVKVGMPAVIFATYLSYISKGHKRAAWLVATISFVLICFITGERWNSILVLSAVILASISFFGMKRAVPVIFITVLGALGILMATFPEVLGRYILFILNLPISSESAHLRAFSSGFFAFLDSPVFGVGPGNLRHLCEYFAASHPIIICANHPHNFYIQLLGETGVVGFVCFLFCLFQFVKSFRLKIKSRTVSSNSIFWLVPFLFLWPISPTSDFFGQWNNIFMWSSLGIALGASKCSFIAVGRES